MTVETRRILVASTAHVSPQTRDWLDAQAARAAAVVGNPASQWPVLPIMAGVYGWQLYAQEEHDPDLPAELAALMKLAIEQGAGWIELDADADTIDGLPTWEW